MKKELLVIGFFCTVISSCSVQRFLPPGERLYRGATIKLDKNKETTTSAKTLESKLNLAATPKPNKFLFGQPYKVWLWYKIGEPEGPKSFRAFLRSKLAEPPVLSSRINAKATAENMQSLMENLGYFHTTVQGDTTNTGRYFMKAHYTAQVQPQYHLAKVEWVNDSSDLVKLLKQNSQKSGLLKSGNPYTLSDITAERERLDLFLKTRGYYYFNPDYLMAYADSTVGERKVDLLMNIKKITPEPAKHAYTINSIKIFPNYSLAPGQLDTTKVNFETYKHLEIRDPKHHYRRHVKKAHKHLSAQLDFEMAPWNMKKPVIASVQGHCYTGALELALACDLLICAESARFADTHGKWSMTPTWGMSQRLPRRIGPVKAKMMMFTGAPITGAQAAELGLANLCVADAGLEAKTHEVAAAVVANSWHTLRADKRLVNEGQRYTLAEGLAFERRTSPGAGPDMAERLKGFGAKS